MAKRTNRYAGILQPRPVGTGSPEVSVLVLYDVENDRIRTRVSEICLNYGLERIQYSAFLGKINRNHRQELTLRMQHEIGDEMARIRVIPITEDSVREMWSLDHYKRTVDVVVAADGETAGPVLPKLRIVVSD